MGSPGSPAYAICICMYYEHIFHTRIQTLQQHISGNNIQLYEGFRYIDDLFALFAYDKTQPITLKFAKLIRLILSKYTYHPNMLLKPETIINNSFCFLETKITYNGSTSFDVIHHDKNFNSLYKNNKITKVKTIHATSFAPRSQKTNIILNTLHRINHNCSSDYLILKATLQHFFVTKYFGYKRKHSKQALNTIAISTNNNLWHTINMLL